MANYKMNFWFDSSSSNKVQIHISNIGAKNLYYGYNYGANSGYDYTIAPSGSLTFIANGYNSYFAISSGENISTVNDLKMLFVWYQHDYFDDENISYMANTTNGFVSFIGKAFGKDNAKEYELTYDSSKPIKTSAKLGGARKLIPFWEVAA